MGEGNGIGVALAVERRRQSCLLRGIQNGCADTAQHNLIPAKVLALVKKTDENILHQIRRGALLDKKSIVFDRDAVKRRISCFVQPQLAGSHNQMPSG